MTDDPVQTPAPVTEGTPAATAEQRDISHTERPDLPSAVTVTPLAKEEREDRGAGDLPAAIEDSQARDAGLDADDPSSAGEAPPPLDAGYDSDSLDADDTEINLLPVSAGLPAHRPPCAPVPVVILAGGKAGMDMEAATGVGSRAVISVGGKPMLLRVVEALKASECCGEITVVGKVPPSDFYSRLPDKGDFVSNTVSGAVANDDAPFVLICTCDLPFLTAESVDDFVSSAVERATRSGASVIYPIVPVDRCLYMFPGLKRTAIKLRDGRYTGGNLMLARPQFLMSQRQRIADAYRARKSPLRLANLLGWDMILRLLFSQTLMPFLLTLPLLERRVSQLVSGPARVFVSGYPEIATDLDRVSDYHAVEEIFERLANGGVLPVLPPLGEPIPGIGKQGMSAPKTRPAKRLKAQTAEPPASRQKPPASGAAPNKKSAQEGKPVARKRSP